MFTSIKIKILAWLLGLILVTAFAVGFSSYGILFDSLMENQKANLVYAAQSEAEHLAEFIEIKERKLKSIALSENVQRYSVTFNGNTLFGYFDKFKEDFPILSFILKQGQEELRIERGVNSTHLVNINTSALYNKLIEQPNEEITLVGKSTRTSEPQIVMGFHRESFFGKFEGIITGRILFSEFFKIFNEVKLGRTGFLMLLNAEGVVLLHPQKDAIMQKVSVRGQDSEKLIAQAVNMKSGFGRANILGVDSFVAYAPVKNRSWSLIAIFPYSEFIAAPNELRNSFLVILIAILIVGVIASFYIASAITKPISKLTRFSNSLANGDLKQRVENRTNDEIAALGRSFNLMAESLESSKLELAAIAKNREYLIEELESKNSELERFTYTVSHDLKSPLVTVKGFVGLLRQDLKDGNADNVAKDLEQIAIASDNMSELLGDLLELSRVGRLENNFEMISLNEVFDIVITLLHGQIEQSKAIIHVQDDMPMVFADKKRISEVVQNLLENAMKFRRKNTIPEIHVTAEQKNEAIICCVADNGIGISPKYHGLIFGLFERLDQSIEGTGIGLALIKRIIEVHKGELTVESAGEGSGAKFCFSLPCNNNSEVEK